MIMIPVAWWAYSFSIRASLLKFKILYMYHSRSVDLDWWKPFLLNGFFNSFICGFYCLTTIKPSYFFSMWLLVSTVVILYKMILPLHRNFVVPTLFIVYIWVGIIDLVKLRLIADPLQVYFFLFLWLNFSILICNYICMSCYFSVLFIIYGFACLPSPEHWICADFVVMCYIA